ncbi:MAG: two-component sensor histidine kinase [Planctomycetes bacterium B3_Pla]|nr:MAG: two-component sensor histidine kinase [Planctomycetes bacterium B3_Pla]
MLQFVGGFVVGLLAVAVLFLRKSVAGTHGHRDNHLEQLEELSKLTGGLAHEIKNPLSTIKINLKLVGEELADSRQAESGGTGANSHSGRLTRALRKVAVIEKEADRLEQILDGFLHYVGRTELQPANTDINELLSDMVDFYSPQAQSHSVTIRQGLHGEPLVCKVDADMLKQVILNLFINAQQAMSSGGELMVRTNRQDRDVIIEISDTGSGIPSDKLEHIFDAYYSSRPRGSGLGLPTAKKIVEAHNGSITVNSEPEKGTSFTIRLPGQAQ